MVNAKYQVPEVGSWKFAIPPGTLFPLLLSRYRVSPMSLFYCLYLLFGFSYPLQYYTGGFPPFGTLLSLSPLFLDG